MQLIFIENKAIPSESISYVDFSNAEPEKNPRYVIVHLKDHTSFRVSNVETIEILVKMFVPSAKQLNYLNMVQRVIG